MSAQQWKDIACTIINRVHLLLVGLPSLDLSSLSCFRTWSSKNTNDWRKNNESMKVREQCNLGAVLLNGAVFLLSSSRNKKSKTKQKPPS